MPDNHEVRELRFRLKQAHATMGRQGQTIYGLRGELAAVREKHDKIERGELQRLETLTEQLIARSVTADRMLQSRQEYIEELQARVVDAEVVDAEVGDTDA